MYAFYKTKKKINKNTVLSDENFPVVHSHDTHNTKFASRRDVY